MAAQVRARRREEILQAALTVFCSNGYDGATMEEIAHRAGIGKSTVYEYFPSKIKLLSAAGDFVLEQIFLDVGQMLSPDRPLRDAIGDYWEYISNVMDSIGPHFLHMVGDRDVTQIIHKLCQQYMETLSARMECLLLAGLERGEVSTDVNIRTAASTIITMSNPQFVHLATKEQLRESIGHLLDMLFLGLAPRS